jgi:predicted nucleic acid-binding protein
LTYLLDTNVVSELRRPERANPGVASWIADIEADAINVSVITLFELERGTQQAERNNPDLGRTLRRWLDTVIMPNYLDRALPVTASVALRAAGLERAPTDDLADHLVAATALEHQLVLVTRNVKHLRHQGVRLLNPFTA